MAMAQSIPDKFSRLKRLPVTSLLLLIGLLVATPARATLIGNTVTNPDLTVSYLNVSRDAGSLVAFNQYPFFDLLTPTDDLYLSGNYQLLCNLSAGSGTLAITGTYDTTSADFWLLGHILRAGDNGDGKAYDFLVQVDSIAPSLQDFGFGGVGSLVYTDLLLNGAVWQSDTVLAAVPEPATLLLFGAGLLLAVGLRRRLA